MLFCYSSKVHTSFLFYFRFRVSISSVSKVHEQSILDSNSVIPWWLACLNHEESYAGFDYLLNGRSIVRTNFTKELGVVFDFDHNLIFICILRMFDWGRQCCCKSHLHLLVKFQTDKALFINHKELLQYPTALKFGYYTSCRILTALNRFSITF